MNISSLKDATAEALAKEAVKILIEKKALDIRLFNVASENSITDFYVNVTGRSSTHVASLADDLADIISNKGREPLRTEGKRGVSWILVDFGDVIVNVFDKASRDFYNFDRLMPAESQLDIAELVHEVDLKMQTIEE